MDIDNIQQSISEKIQQEDFSSRNISYDDVESALKLLNQHKRDGGEGTYSDHFIHGPRRLKVMISLLFSSILTHGYTPQKLLEATIVSIPKDMKKDLSDSDNQRGIALCSAMCKIFDLVIINRYGDKLNSSKLQFAFKQEHSTTACTGIIKEVVKHYNDRGSAVFSCLIDASKAFDRVSFVKLFELLIKRGLPSIVIRTIIDMYLRQRIRTEWCGATSEYFTVTNGTKQGQILSPLLYNCYMDELIIIASQRGWNWVSHRK